MNAVRGCVKRSEQSKAVFPALLFCQLVVQQFADAPLEPREIERLGKKILSLHGHGALGDLAGKRAHEYDGDFFCGRLAAQDFADRQSIQIRQQDVEQDKIRLKLPRLAERLHTVGGHQKFTAQRGEAKLHQLDEIALVVHD